MAQQLFEWSYQNLGQWHYVLGYLIVLVGHNWPLLLSAGLASWWGALLYRTPTQARVCWFFAALLLGLAYEYHKHIGPALHASMDTILGLELLWLNRPAHIIIGPLTELLLFAALAFFLGRALWLDSGAWRRRPAPPRGRQPEPRR